MGLTGGLALTCSPAPCHRPAGVAADETLPEMVRDLFAIHTREYVQLQAEIEKVETRLMAWHRADECSRRLAQIPGVGPIGWQSQIGGHHPCRRRGLAQHRRPMSADQSYLLMVPVVKLNAADSKVGRLKRGYDLNPRYLSFFSCAASNRVYVGSAGKDRPSKPKLN